MLRFALNASGSVTTHCSPSKRGPRAAGPSGGPPVLERGREGLRELRVLLDLGLEDLGLRLQRGELDLQRRDLLLGGVLCGFGAPTRDDVVGLGLSGLLREK